MSGKVSSEQAPAAEEEEFTLRHAISHVGETLTQVPEQKEPLNPSAVSADMEGTQTFNTLPEIGLSGSKKSSIYEQEDGVIRSGTIFSSSFSSFSASSFGPPTAHNMHILSRVPCQASAASDPA